MSFSRHFMAETSMIGEEAPVKGFNRATRSDWCINGTIQVRLEGPILEVGRVVGRLLQRCRQKMIKICILVQVLRGSRVARNEEENVHSGDRSQFIWTW